MRVISAFVLVAAIVAAGVSVQAQAQAQAQVPRFEQEVQVKAAPLAGSPSDHFLTFSAPIALPGVSLAAGTYVFTQPVHGVLQVMDATRDVSYAMLFTAPVTRVADLDKYEVWFAGPLAPGAPYRITKWFAPGSSTGQELIYKNPEVEGDER